MTPIPPTNVVALVPRMRVAEQRDASADRMTDEGIGCLSASFLALLIEAPFAVPLWCVL